MVEDIIAEQIANIMVLPNRIAVPMIEELNLSLLKYPPPEVGQGHRPRKGQGEFFYLFLPCT